MTYFNRCEKRGTTEPLGIYMLKVNNISTGTKCDLP